MKVLDKAGLLEEFEPAQEEITLRKGKAIVREVSATEYMAAYESPLAKNEVGEFDGTKFTALLATRCIVDVKGKRIFTDDDADLLRNGSSSTFTKLGAAVKRLNGLGGEVAKN